MAGGYSGFNTLLCRSRYSETLISKETTYKTIGIQLIVVTLVVTVDGVEISLKVSLWPGIGQK